MDIPANVMNNPERVNNGNVESEELYNSDNYLPSSFKNQSYEIARDIVLYTVHGKEHVGPPPNQASQAMRELVDDMIDNRKEMMVMLAQQLDVKKKEHLNKIMGVAAEMFNDDVVTWSRIVSLHAFCGYIAKYCHTQLFIPHSSEEISNLLAEFVVNRLGLWIVSQGAWKGFEKQFPKLGWRTDGVWKGILIALVFLGAVASLYVFIHWKHNAKDEHSVHHSKPH